jgi:hypothetical protein
MQKQRKFVRNPVIIHLQTPQCQPFRLYRQAAFFVVLLLFDDVVSRAAQCILQQTRAVAQTTEGAVMLCW